MKLLDASSWSPGPPLRGGGLGFNVLDIGGEHPHLEVGGPGGEEHVVGVPVHRGDRASDWPLDVLGHPPVVVLLVITDGDDLGTAPHRKLVLLRAPPDKIIEFQYKN